MKRLSMRARTVLALIITIWVLAGDATAANAPEAPTVHGGNRLSGGHSSHR